MKMKYKQETHLKKGDSIVTDMGTVRILERIGFNIYKGELRLPKFSQEKQSYKTVCIEPVVKWKVSEW
jgi:hypothetical protein